METLLVVGTRLAADEKVLRFLERQGHRALTATTREAGLAQMQAERPPIAIVEHHVHECNGLELLRELRALDPSCEVILVTSGGDVEVAIEALRAGALDYLKYPIDLGQLRIALGRARERRVQRPVQEPAAILVLDDHEPTRTRLARVLEKEGYRVATGADGAEGARLLQEMRIDLVMADLKMPHKDGLTLLHETREAGIDVEFIVTTGYGDEETVVRALRDGANNFLRKPLDLEQMLLAVQKALEYQTIRRSLAYRNRDIELMQELVVRLTRKLEIIVETPGKLSHETVGFLHRLVNSLPLGLVVVGEERQILFANRHVIEKAGEPPEKLSTEWLEPVGVTNVTEETLDEVFHRTIGNRLGTIETVMLTKWSFLVMTPLTLVGRDTTERYVAVVIRGERTPTHG